jgi:hypothetical protein
VPAVRTACQPIFAIIFAPKDEPSNPSKCLFSSAVRFGGVAAVSLRTKDLCCRFREAEIEPAGDPKAAGSDVLPVEARAAGSGVGAPGDETLFVASRDEDPIPPRKVLDRISVTGCGDSDAEGAAED